MLYVLPLLPHHHGGSGSNGASQGRTEPSFSFDLASKNWIFLITDVKECSKKKDLILTKAMKHEAKVSINHQRAKLVSICGYVRSLASIFYLRLL